MRHDKTRGAISAPLVLGFVCLSLAASPAEAASERRAAVVAVPLGSGIERETAIVAQAIEAMVASTRDDVELVDLAWLGDRRTTALRQERLDRGKALLERATRSYQEYEFEEAIHLVDGAIASLEQADLVRDISYLLQAHALRAAAAYYKGDMEDARLALERLLYVDPGFVFEGQMFPPALRDMATEQRREVFDRSQVGVEVLVRGAPARVYLNGEYKGISPVELSGLPPVDHIITIRAPGYQVLQERQGVAPGRLLRLDAKVAYGGDFLLDLLDDLRERMSEHSVSRPAAAVASWAEVEEVLVAGVVPEEGRLRVVMARVADDGHILATARRTMPLEDDGALTDVATAASRLYEHDIPRGPGGAPVAPDVRVTPLVDMMTVGFVTGGVGIAAGIGGAVMALHASRTAQSGKQLPQRHQEEIGAINDRARRSALIADILYGTALVAIITGSYLAAPALSPAASEPIGEGRREFYSVAPVPLQDGAMLTLEGRF